ncbi:PDDEXK family nuclease [Tenuifilum thalassicum]|uniref:DUF91 domain-containing protein n=1 Tax=Tenuifilum thalassicum TaxID=2590900 RepID=A0A7D4BER1_9BACT|nr:endonuclease NucS [Tenuifilum thalassicum]QKG80963.1 DUF91 domain-containing protein [Tenuifilum thalassicum]
MATEIKTWEIINGELKEINNSLAENGRKEKDDLEKWLKTNPKILGEDILIFGEQVWTKSGPLDYLGIDNSGNLVIVELKRDKLAREVLSQAIDYASDVANWDIEKLNEICLKYSDNSLEDYIADNFENVELDDLLINNAQRILLVGFSIDEALSRMIEWLSSKYDLGINAIILNYVKTSSGNELLSRTVIIPEEIEKEKTNKKKFSIPMSDEPGNYEPERLKELLKNYLNNNQLSSKRIRDILLPVLLKKDKTTREQLKKEFVKAGEATDENKAGYFIALISNQLGQEKKDFLRQIISYDYPKYHWEKDNFSIRPEYRDLVKEIIENE